MNKDYNTLISQYIEDDLDKEVKKSFETYMKENPEFSNKVDKIKNNIFLFQSLPKVETSKNFLSKLDSKISKNESKEFWFLPNLKTAFPLGFSLMILFFILINYESKGDNYLANQSNSEQNLIETKIDSLIIDDFEIKRVKGSNIKK